MVVSKRRTTGRAGFLTAEDWVRAAVGAIEEGGVGAVAVEPLAKKLGVTKGSFYWHFENRDALLRAVLEWWQREATEAAISATRSIAAPRERLVRLTEEAFGDDPHRVGSSPEREISLGRTFELAISDAADDPIVRPVLRHVTERRIDYLEECYRSLGFSPEEASHRALLVYAAYAGTMRLVRDAPGRLPTGEGYRSYKRHLAATLVPEGDAR